MTMMKCGIGNFLEKPLGALVPLFYECDDGETPLVQMARRHRPPALPRGFFDRL